MSFSISPNGAGTAFAIIRGGNNDGKILYFSTEKLIGDFTSQNITNPIDLLNKEGYFSKFKKNPKKKFSTIRELLIMNGEEVPPDLEEEYERTKQIIEEQSGRNIILEDGTLELIPNPDPNYREKMFIAAPTGYGKTGFACKYLRMYQQLFQREVFIFTPDPDDDTIKKCLNFTPIFIDIFEKEKAEDEENNIDEEEIIDELFEGSQVISKKKENKKRKRKNNEFEVVKNPLNPKEFVNCAILFDDLKNIHQPQVKTAITKFASEMIGIGRHSNVTVVITNQFLTDYRNTREILMEANWIVVFTEGVYRNLEYFLSEYMKIPRQSKITNKLKKLNTRWIAFHMIRPQFYLYETGVSLFPEDDETE